MRRALAIWFGLDAAYALGAAAVCVANGGCRAAAICAWLAVSSIVAASGRTWGAVALVVGAAASATELGLGVDLWLAAAAIVCTAPLARVVPLMWRRDALAAVVIVACSLAAGAAGACVSAIVVPRSAPPVGSVPGWFRDVADDWNEVQRIRAENHELRRRIRELARSAGDQ